MNSALSSNDFTRYARQIAIPDFGEEGQKALKAARVAVIGSGGLGAPVLQYLAAAGVGFLGILDDDIIEESNLQRQVLFREADIGLKKVNVTARYIQALNSNIVVEPHDLRLNAGNAIALLTGYDLVIDGSDNFLSRTIINDACIVLDIPFVFGAIYQFEGQVAVFNFVDKAGKRGPDYRSLFPELPKDGFIPNCAEAGVIGALPGIIGSIQALEAIKIITGIGKVLSGKLLMMDALSMHFSTIDLGTIPQNNNDYIHTAKERLERLERQDSNNKEEGCMPVDVKEISPAEFFKIRDSENVDLIDVRGHNERKAIAIGGMHIPFVELEQSLSLFDNEKVKILCCNRGETSKKAIRLLQVKHDIENLLNLQGGIMAWKEFEDSMKESQKPDSKV